MFAIVLLLYMSLPNYALLALFLPLLPIQLLLTSLITDLPLIAIAADTVNTEEMLRPEMFSLKGDTSAPTRLCTAFPGFWRVIARELTI